MAGILLTICILIGSILWLLTRRRRVLAGSAKQPLLPLEERSGCRRRFCGLQFRMTFSYVWITIASLLLFFIPLNIIGFLANGGNTTDTMTRDVAVVNTTARQYATEIALQAQGKELGAVFPYPLGERLQNVNPETYVDSEAANLLRSINAVPYLSRLYPNSQPVSFALLIAPDLRILSSSYPLRYTPGAMVADLLPARLSLFHAALAGTARQGTFPQAAGTMIYATATVWSRAGQPAGAIYVQVPLTTLHASSSQPGLLTYVTSSLSAILVLLVILAPLGGIFGFISTRGMVKRLKHLAFAARQVADGYYSQSLPVASRDEVGQLEQQFNRMAEQLGESTEQQKKLAAENARLAERSRISRELHDAISQDLFSLSMLAGGLQSAMPADSPLQLQATTLEQTTSTMIREMRALLLELRPTSLEQLELTGALEALAAAYSTRLGIVVHTHLASILLEPRLEHALLRIAQEGLSNAARHSNASEISLTLAREADSMVFSVRDNGQGLKRNDESLRHGLGLRLTQERVQELDGTLRLTSIPDRGTLLEVRIPLKEERDDPYCDC